MDSITTCKRCVIGQVSMIFVQVVFDLCRSPLWTTSFMLASVAKFQAVLQWHLFQAQTA